MSHMKLMIVALGVLFIGTATTPLASARNHTQASGNHAQKWNAMDTNGDGIVSMQEYRAYVSETFKQADTSADGAIDVDEGYARMRTAYRSGEIKNGSMHPSRSARMWHAADTDGDGSISAAENMAYKMKLFRQADANHDKQLSKAEWQQLGMLIRNTYRGTTTPAQ